MKKNNLIIIGLLFSICLTTLLILSQPVSASFPAGTLVQTVKGLKPIESVKSGDSVIVYDFKKDKKVPAKISKVIESFHAQIITIKTEGHELKATGNHVFCVARKTGEPIRHEWRKAFNLRAGHHLLLGDGTTLNIINVSRENKKTKVYNLVIPEHKNFLVSPSSIIVKSAEDYSSGSGSTPGNGGSGNVGGCFPADTPVLTTNGTVLIAHTAPGIKVHSYNLKSGQWEFSRIKKVNIRSYKGEMITIGTEVDLITATSNHPFWVLKGAELNTRPWPAEVPAGETSSRGRWVEAGDLKEGDLLFVYPGTKQQIISLRAERKKLPVYNLVLEGNHNYLVQSGILVHNKGSAEAPPSVAADSSDDSFREYREDPIKEYPDSPSEPYSEKPAASLKESESKKDSPPEGGLTSTTGSSGDRKKTAASGLKAGFVDDNKQFNYFLNFLENFDKEAAHLVMKVNERIILKITDENGKSLAGARVRIFSDKELLCHGLSYASGKFYFFPSEHGKAVKNYKYEVQYKGKTTKMTFSRSGKREIPVTFNLAREKVNAVPLDLLFIFDTTGSMGGEIERLKATIEIIYQNLAYFSSKPDIRLGMVLYKDIYDSYVTRVVPLTSDLEQFKKALATVSASGGGDGPEDLQSALQAAMKEINWNKEGIRLSFVITDAPPHLDYNQSYTYVDASREAREEGIKIYTVGTGGLDINGEYVLRQISQYTGGRYIFLTYGEKGESEGGAPGSVSHHTGDNFVSDKLETVIIRIAKEELTWLTDQEIKIPDEYFTAAKINNETNEETLQKLFRMALQQNIDYSSTKIEPKTPIGVMLVRDNEEKLDKTGEYFTEQIIFTLKNDSGFKKAFRLVERQDLEKILAEQNFQLSGLMDESTVMRVGNLMGARMLFLGTLYEKAGEYEIFIKLTNVETGEILSVSKAVIASKLGL